jgi:hypothetical protein
MNADVLLKDVRSIVYKDGDLDRTDVSRLRAKLKELDEHLSKGGQFPRLWVTQENRTVYTWWFGHD